MGLAALSQMGVLGAQAVSWWGVTPVIRLACEGELSILGQAWARRKHCWTC